MIQKLLLPLLLRVRPFRLAVLLARLASIRRRVTTLPPLGFSLHLDPMTVIGSALALGDLYEPELSRLVRGILRPGDTFFDVGANEGYMSILGATAASGIAVSSFEPNPETARLLAANIALNRLDNIQVHQVALADKPGDSRLTNPRHSGAAGLEQLHPKTNASIPVVTATLDEFTAVAGQIRLVKVDCEGSELLVFRGATSTLKRRIVDCYVVEYHPRVIGEAACREIDGRLRASGYECTAVDGLWVYHLPEVLRDLARLGSTAPVPRI